MKRMTAVILACFIAAGCSPANRNDTILKNGGYGVLRSDCETLFRSIDPSQTGSADPTNYPASIIVLRPQFVGVHRLEPPVLIIQTSGGFRHEGILVVLGTNLTYRPTIGHGWVQKELAPGVFEFRE